MKKGTAIYKNVLLIIALVLSSFNYVISQKKIPSDSSGLAISYIYFNEPNNTVELHCSLSNEILLEELAASKARWKLTIDENGVVYEDVVIKRAEQLSNHQFILHVQSPLPIAVYSINKKTFLLQFVGDRHHFEVHKEAVLGSALRHSDLRPYTHYSALNHMLWILAIVLTLTGILYISIPLVQKFRFKKNHIKKYHDLANEEGPKLDPFTFSVIQDKASIVVIEDQLMLLSSWKRINKLSDSNLTQKFSHFFKEKLEGTFFRPRSKNFEIVNRAWFGVLGITVGWLLYYAISSTGLHQFFQFFYTLFDSNSFQVSTVIIRDTLLGFSMGSCYGIALVCADMAYHDMGFSMAKLIRSTAIRASLFTFCFALQALLAAYLIQDFYISAWVSWLLIGVAFAFSSPKFLRNFSKSLVAGILGFGFYFAAVTSPLFELMGAQLALFTSILFLGGIITCARKLETLNKNVLLNEAKEEYSFAFDISSNLKFEKAPKRLRKSSQ